MKTKLTKERSTSPLVASASQLSLEPQSMYLLSLCRGFEIGADPTSSKAVSSSLTPDDDGVSPIFVRFLSLSVWSNFSHCPQLRLTGPRFRTSS